MTLWVVVFVASILALVKAAQLFTGAAERVYCHFGMPSFIVGVTIVALGTSLPELLSSIYAVSAGSSEIVIGNVLGSNISNVFLVLGISAILAGRMETVYNLVHVDLPFLAGSAALLAVTTWDGRFTLPEAFLCLAALVVYMLYAVATASEEGDADDDEPARTLDRNTILILLGSVVLLYFGARYTVESLINISSLANIGTEIIAASAVAFGTSLPELAVSVTASRQGNKSMVIGNVLGSNIFNALGVMAIPRLFGPLALPTDMLDFALPMMVLATLLYLLITQDKQITKWEGWLLILFYVLFIGKLFSLL